MVKKTDYSSKITLLENKIPNASGFLLTSVFNSKITEVGNKIPDIKNLASKTEVTAVENKIPNVSNLVTKTDYATEITKIKNDYVTNAALDARHKGLVQKTTFESELKNVEDKVSANSSKVLSYEHKLKEREDTLHDLERDAFYFRGKNYFGDDGLQNDLVFQVCQKYLDSTWDQDGFWRSKGFLINTCSLNIQMLMILALKMSWKTNRCEIFLYQKDRDLLTLENPPIINICITYKTLAKNLNSKFTLRNYLFGAVKITNKSNSDKDMWQYNEYGIAFD